MTEQSTLLTQLMNDKEAEQLEFKEAKEAFPEERLMKYCAALANECGGKLVLGITDRFPRQVVGTNAFRNLDKIKIRVVECLRLRVDVEEIFDSEKRVLVFSVLSRPIGWPIEYKGGYWMRAWS